MVIARNPVLARLNLQQAYQNLVREPGYLTLYIAAVILPLILLMAAAWWAWRGVDAEARIRVERVSAAMEEHARRIFEVQESLLFATLAHVRGRSFDDIANDPQVAEFLAGLEQGAPSSRTMVLVRPDNGRVIARSRPAQSASVDASRRDYYLALRRQDSQRFIGEVVRGMVTGETGFTVSRRDPVTGLIAASQIKISEFITYYESIRESDQDAMTLVRDDGAALVMLARASDLVGYRLPADSVFYRLARGELAAPVRLPSQVDGVARLWTLRRVGNWPAYALYGLDSNRVNANWSSRLLPFAVLSLAASLLLLYAVRRAERASRAQQLAVLEAQRAKVRAEHADALAASGERLRRAQTAANVGVWEWHPGGGVGIWSPETWSLFKPGGSGPVTFEQWAACLHPDDREQAIETSRAAQSGKSQFYENEFRVVHPDGTVRWLRSTGRVDHDPGQTAVMRGVTLDVTERKRSEEHLRFLMRELSHRSKNLLAVIQSLARQTARGVDTVAEFEQRFAGRIGALSRSIDRLARQDWRGVDLAGLVRDQLETFVETGSQRLTVTGSPVLLTADAAQTIGLALHELATNAAKYGALSNDRGSVHVGWDLAGTPNDRRLQLRWEEAGGPPVEQPRTLGFGSTAIVAMTRMSLDAEVSLDYPPTGVVWTLNCPVSKAVDERS